MDLFGWEIDELGRRLKPRMEAAISIYKYIMLSFKVL